MSELLPSEIARLILGYLESKNYTNTAKAMLSELPELQEIDLSRKLGKKTKLRVGDMELIDFMDDYYATKELVLENRRKNPVIFSKIKKYQLLYDQINTLFQIQLSDYNRKFKTKNRNINSNVLSLSVENCISDNVAVDSDRNDVTPDGSPFKDTDANTITQKAINDVDENSNSRSNSGSPRRKTPSKHVITDDDLSSLLVGKEHERKFVSTLINNQWLHEKIAENINKSLSLRDLIVNENPLDQSILDSARKPKPVIVHAVFDNICSELTNDLDLDSIQTLRRQLNTPEPLNRQENFSKFNPQNHESNESCHVSDFLTFNEAGSSNPASFVPSSTVSCSPVTNPSQYSLQSSNLAHSSSNLISQSSNLLQSNSNINSHSNLPQVNFKSASESFNMLQPYSNPIVSQSSNLTHSSSALIVTSSTSYKPSSNLLQPNVVQTSLNNLNSSNSLGGFNVTENDKLVPVSENAAQICTNTQETIEPIISDKNIDSSHLHNIPKNSYTEMCISNYESVSIKSNATDLNKENSQSVNLNSGSDAENSLTSISFVTSFLQGVLNLNKTSNGQVKNLSETPEQSTEYAITELDTVRKPTETHSAVKVITPQENFEIIETENFKRKDVSEIIASSSKSNSNVLERKNSTNKGKFSESILQKSSYSSSSVENWKNSIPENFFSNVYCSRRSKLKRRMIRKRTKQTDENRLEGINRNENFHLSGLKNENSHFSDLNKENSHFSDLNKETSHLISRLNNENSYLNDNSENFHVNDSSDKNIIGTEDIIKDYCKNNGANEKLKSLIDFSRKFDIDCNSSKILKSGSPKKWQCHRGSLSTPRNKKHIRALDFNTPIKDNSPPKKAQSSSKIVAHKLGPSNFGFNNSHKPRKLETSKEVLEAISENSFEKSDKDHVAKNKNLETISETIRECLPHSDKNSIQPQFSVKNSPKVLNTITPLKSSNSVTIANIPQTPIIHDALADLYLSEDSTNFPTPRKPLTNKNFPIPTMRKIADSDFRTTSGRNVNLFLIEENSNLSNISLETPVKSSPNERSFICLEPDTPFGVLGTNSVTCEKPMNTSLELNTPVIIQPTVPHTPASKPAEKRNFHEIFKTGKLYEPLKLLNNNRKEDNINMNSQLEKVSDLLVSTAASSNKINSFTSAEILPKFVQINFRKLNNKNKDICNQIDRDIENDLDELLSNSEEKMRKHFCTQNENRLQNLEKNGKLKENSANSQKTSMKNFNELSQNKVMILNEVEAICENNKIESNKIMETSENNRLKLNKINEISENEVEFNKIKEKKENNKEKSSNIKENVESSKVKSNKNEFANISIDKMNINDRKNERIKKKFKKVFKRKINLLKHKKKKRSKIDINVIECEINAVVRNNSGKNQVEEAIKNIHHKHKLIKREKNKLSMKRKLVLKKVLARRKKIIRKEKVEEINKKKVTLTSELDETAAPCERFNTEVDKIPEELSLNLHLSEFENDNPKTLKKNESSNKTTEIAECREMDLIENESDVIENNHSDNENIDSRKHAIEIGESDSIFENEYSKNTKVPQIEGEKSDKIDSTFINVILKDRNAYIIESENGKLENAITNCKNVDSRPENIDENVPEAVCKNVFTENKNLNKLENEIENSFAISENDISLIVEITQLSQACEEISPSDKEKLEISSSEKEKLEISSSEKEKLEISTLDDKKLEMSTSDKKKLEISTSDKKKLEMSTSDKKKLEISTSDKKKLEISTLDKKKLEISTSDKKKLETSTSDKKKLGISTSDKKKLVSDKKKIEISTSDKENLEIAEETDELSQDANSDERESPSLSWLDFFTILHGCARSYVYTRKTKDIKTRNENLTGQIVNITTKSKKKSQRKRERNTSIVASQDPLRSIEEELGLLDDGYSPITGYFPITTYLPGGVNTEVPYTPSYDESSQDEGHPVFKKTRPPVSLEIPSRNDFSDTPVCISKYLKICSPLQLISDLKPVENNDYLKQSSFVNQERDIEHSDSTLKSVLNCVKDAVTTNLKLPNTATNSKSPNTATNSRSPNTANNSNLSDAAANLKSPNIAANSNSPNTAINSKLLNTPTHSKLPNTTANSKSSNTATNSKLPNKTNSKSSITATNSKSPNAATDSKSRGNTVTNSKSPIKELFSRTCNSKSSNKESLSGTSNSELPKKRSLSETFSSNLHNKKVPLEAFSSNSPYKELLLGHSNLRSLRKKSHSETSDLRPLNKKACFKISNLKSCLEMSDLKSPKNRLLSDSPNLHSGIFDSQSQKSPRKFMSYTPLPNVTPEKMEEICHSVIKDNLGMVAIPSPSRVAKISTSSLFSESFADRIDPYIDSMYNNNQNAKKNCKNKSEISINEITNKMDQSTEVSNEITNHIDNDNSEDVEEDDTIPSYQENISKNCTGDSVTVNQHETQSKCFYEIEGGKEFLNDLYENMVTVNVVKEASLSKSHICEKDNESSPQENDKAVNSNNSTLSNTIESNLHLYQHSPIKIGQYKLDEVALDRFESDPSTTLLTLNRAEVHSPHSSYGESQELIRYKSSDNSKDYLNIHKNVMSDYNYPEITGSPQIDSTQYRLKSSEIDEQDNSSYWKEKKIGVDSFINTFGFEVEGSSSHREKENVIRLYDLSSGEEFNDDDVQCLRYSKMYELYSANLEPGAVNLNATENRKRKRYETDEEKSVSESEFEDTEHHASRLRLLENIMMNGISPKRKRINRMSKCFSDEGTSLISENYSSDEKLENSTNELTDSNKTLQIISNKRKERVKRSKMSELQNLAIGKRPKNSSTSNSESNSDSDFTDNSRSIKRRSLRKKTKTTPNFKKIKGKYVNSDGSTVSREKALPTRKESNLGIEGTSSSRLKTPPVGQQTSSTRKETLSVRKEVKSCKTNQSDTKNKEIVADRKNAAVTNDTNVTNDRNIRSKSIKRPSNRKLTALRNKTLNKSKNASRNTTNFDEIDLEIQEKVLKSFEGLESSAEVAEIDHKTNTKVLEVGRKTKSQVARKSNPNVSKGFRTSSRSDYNNKNFSTQISRNDKILSVEVLKELANTPPKKKKCGENSVSYIIEPENIEESNMPKKVAGTIKSKRTRGKISSMITSTPIQTDLIEKERSRNSIIIDPIVVLSPISENELKSPTILLSGTNESPNSTLKISKSTKLTRKRVSSPIVVLSPISEKKLKSPTIRLSGKTESPTSTSKISKPSAVNSAKPTRRSVLSSSLNTISKTPRKAKSPTKTKKDKSPTKKKIDKSRKNNSPTTKKINELETEKAQPVQAKNKVQSSSKKNNSPRKSLKKNDVELSEDELCALLPIIFN